MIATAAAASQLTMLRMWVNGEAACPSPAPARQMMACARLAGGEALPVAAA